MFKFENNVIFLNAVHMFLVSTLYIVAQLLPTWIYIQFYLFLRNCMTFRGKFHLSIAISSIFFTRLGVFPQTISVSFIYIKKDKVQLVQDCVMNQVCKVMSRRLAQRIRLQAQNHTQITVLISSSMDCKYKQVLPYLSIDHSWQTFWDFGDSGNPLVLPQPLEAPAASLI